jgi:phosphate:Na+ symporter
MKKFLGFLVLVSATFGGSGVVYADAPAPKVPDVWKTIADDDATGHFELGKWWFKQYSSKQKNIEALEHAKAELAIAAGLFDYTPKGATVSMAVSVGGDEPKNWDRLVADCHDAIDNIYQRLYVKEEKKKSGSTSPAQYKPERRMVVLYELMKAKDIDLKPRHPDAKMMFDAVKDKHNSVDTTLHPDGWMMAFSIIGGLGIFLLGMKNMSEGVQAIAGNRMRRWISMATDKRLSAVGTGTLVTCLVQSSSITTVLVVGFVNGGLMLLHQGIGVVMGANIGTTITGWILVLQIGKWGLPIWGISGFVYLFSKSDRWRFLALAVMGLGMVFYGLVLMKEGFAPLRGIESFNNAFQEIDGSTFTGVLWCVGIGSALTAVVQSSSATLGITIALAMQGIMSFETAVALVLGQNIGTTITAYLASLGTTTNAKRVAYFHIFFNVAGVILVVSIFGLYVSVISSGIAMLPGGVDPRLLDFETSAGFSRNMTFSIATAHTVFNVMMTLVMLPLAGKWAQFLCWLVPDSTVKETHHLTHLDVRMVDSPVIGLEQSRREILNMADGVRKMLDWTGEIIKAEEPDEALVKKVFNREEIMDKVQLEVVRFLNDLQTGVVPHSVTEEARQQYRISDEFESISDYVSTLLKAHLRLVHDDQRLTDDELVKLQGIHAQVMDYLMLVISAFEARQTDILTKAVTQGEAITHHFKDLRETHLQRVAEQKIDPMYSMSYNSMLRAYRKIKDHSLNIAEAIAGEK